MTATREQTQLDRIETYAKLSATNVLNTAECALLMGITPERLRHLVCNREVPHYKYKNRLRFKKDEIESMLTANRVQTKEEINAKAAAYIHNKRKR